MPLLRNAVEINPEIRAVLCLLLFRTRKDKISERILSAIKVVIGE